MASLRYLFISVTLLCAIISMGCILGGYIPNKSFNDRAQPRICQIYYSVYSYWCRAGYLTQECYSVDRNVQPNGTTCWSYDTIAHFTNKDLANQYAHRYASYSHKCYWDPNHPCTYYDDLADVQGTLIAGVVFVSVASISALALLIMELHRKGCFSKRTLLYNELNPENSSGGEASM
jgi:hypothetical protein